MSRWFAGIAAGSVLLLLFFWNCQAESTTLTIQQPTESGLPSKGAVDSAQPKLKKQLESLQALSGLWHCQGVFPSSGKHIESQIQFTADLDGAWLVVRHDDLPPNVFHALEMWGFDENAKQFVAFIYDNFGGVRKFTSPGWAEQKLLWLGQPSASATATPFLERFMFALDASGQLVVNWEVKKGAADWKIGDTLTCTK
jgi:hypothetical protein